MTGKDMWLRISMPQLLLRDRKCVLILTRWLKTLRTALKLETEQVNIRLRQKKDWDLLDPAKEYLLRRYVCLKNI